MPDYEDRGSLVVHTEPGDLWMDYLEVRTSSTAAQIDLWVDDTPAAPSTGRPPTRRLDTTP
jgi:hypothetical protein